ncbi:MAG: tRNA pseudouridine(55) synthase TruB [Flavicella sp.]|nr:tRNA pseudouridine(55) synthase TruB [Flavicella sp.]
MTAEDYKNGQLVLIDKPLTWTSFQVVNKIRWEIRQRFALKKIKVGHAGTLDPLATGLLILCVGKLTKQIDQYQAQEKEYTGIIRVGGTTPTYDLESEVDQHFPTEHLTPELIIETTRKFTGEIAQKPPIFSALKKEGKRLYELARAGEKVEVPSRKVTISTFEITEINLPNIAFRVVCSKGTYIRSLAYDFGKALQSGAHLSALRRTKIGDFSVANAMSVDAFIAQLQEGDSVDN